MWKTPFGVLGVLCLLTPTPSEARITKIEITNTSEPAPDGYITLTGTAYGEVDPTHPLNTIIQDIELAPRNERGMVEYSMDMTIQKPPDGGSGILFYEVVNRGWPMNQMPGRFIGINNLARQRGYTVVTSGWQGDLVKLPDPPQQIIYVPTATDSGTEISGKVRVAYAPAEAASTMLLSSTFGIPMRSYEPVSLSDAGAVLKRYPRNGDSPAVVPREDWAFANCSDTEFPGTPSPMHLCLKEGFSPASMYELVYTAKKPLVLGLGFAATRDLVAFLRHEVADDLGNPNPVAGGMRAALMQGPSQSGFFVRTFLHLGFNLDENQRIVFEGMNPHIGPSRLVLNARFALGAGVDPAQVNRPGWPASPFTLMPVYDPLAKRSGWIFERCLETIESRAIE